MEILPALTPVVKKIEEQQQSGGGWCEVEIERPKAVRGEWGFFWRRISVGVFGLGPERHPGRRLSSDDRWFLMMIRYDGLGMMIN